MIRNVDTRTLFGKLSKKKSKTVHGPDTCNTDVRGQRRRFIDKTHRFILEEEEEEEFT